jgi:N utilization substance protein A
VSRVFFDAESGAIQAVVDEDQLSLAIGKHGQNVRLASELTGWKIDLFSSREWVDRGGEGPLFAPLEPAEDLAADVGLGELRGFPTGLVETLQSAGYQSLRDILDLERSDVLAIEGMSPENVDILMGFLSEVTEEAVPEDAEGGATAASQETSTETAAAETGATEAEIPAAERTAVATVEADAEETTKEKVAEGGSPPGEEAAPDSAEGLDAEPERTPTA